MSTADVPGFDKKNNDKLAMGSWAEHEDGSLIFVQATEGGRVIFEMFDPTMQDQMFRHAMPEKDFKEKFSFKSGKSIADQKWTWHDKTVFPWDRVIQSGVKPGVHFRDAVTQISAELKVAEALDLKSSKIDTDQLSTRQAREILSIASKLKEALKNVDV